MSEPIPFLLQHTPELVRSTTTYPSRGSILCPIATQVTHWTLQFFSISLVDLHIHRQKKPFCQLMVFGILPDEYLLPQPPLAVEKIKIFLCRRQKDFLQDSKRILFSVYIPFLRDLEMLLCYLFIYLFTYLFIYLLRKFLRHHKSLNFVHTINHRFWELLSDSIPLCAL